MKARVAAVVGLVALAVLPLLAQAARTPDLDLPTDRAVQVVYVDGLGLDDIGSGRVPTLDQLAERGAVGALTTRGAADLGRARAVARLGLADLVRDDTIRTDGPGLPGRIRGDDANERALATAVDRMAPGDVLVVVGVVPAQGRNQFGPLVIVGDDIEAGHLWSSSTRRTGLAVPADVAATVRHLAGAEPDATSAGDADPLRVDAGDNSVAPLLEIEDWSQAQRPSRLDAYDAIRWTAAVASALVAIVLLWRRVPSLVRTLVELTALTVAAYPLGSVIGLVVVGRPIHSIATVSISWAVGTVVALGAHLTRRWHRLPPLVLVAGATVAVFAVDLAAGSVWQLRLPLSYSALVGARFYGLGNESFAQLAGAIAVAAILVDRSWRPFVLAAGVIVVGSPALGADFGGVVALAVAATVLLLDQRPWWWAPVGLVVAGAAAATLVLVVDAVLPGGAPTHLGRFLDDLLNDPASARATLERKWEWSTARHTAGSWMVLALPPVVAVLATRRWTRPVVTVVVLGVVGTLVNDSGWIVAGLVVAWLPALLVLDDQRDAPAGAPVSDRTTPPEPALVLQPASSSSSRS